VEIKKLRHSNLKIYSEEGYGGKQIEFFPPFKFLLQYHVGNKSNSEANFTKWYFDSYLKYFNEPKSIGGMKFGSLDSRIRKLNIGEINSKTIVRNSSIVINEIKVLVSNKFHLYESIKKDGLNLFKRDRIRVVNKSGKFLIEGGHHRVAILKILGYRSAPVYIEDAHAKS